MYRCRCSMRTSLYRNPLAATGSFFVASDPEVVRKILTVDE